VEVDDDAAGGYELAYREAVRALAQQREAFESLRTRAGVLLAGAAITSSLLGRQAFTPGHLSILGWIALASFLGLGATLLSVLWPRPQWDATPSPIRLIETRIELDEPLPLAAIHRDLAYAMSQAQQENQMTYEFLTRHFRAAAVLLGAEVFSLIAGLASQA
jgi:hypothetical protein